MGFLTSNASLTSFRTQYERSVPWVCVAVFVFLGACVLWVGIVGVFVVVVGF